MADTKKNILTFAGLKALEDELFELKVNKRREEHRIQHFQTSLPVLWLL